jgi:D-alanyl-D-alanine carboxypeptidase (penicillin-binding protein 5/6)
MLKKIFRTMLAGVLALGALPVPSSRAAVALPITAPSAVVLDQRGVLYSKTPFLRRMPASTVKVLTAMVAMDLAPLDRMVVIPKYVEKIQPSKIYLRGGERYRVRDLIRAILLNSANDAAEALAYTTAGSRGRFLNAMNRKARALGCRHSNFAQPSGLPGGNQYTTAYDMALIMRNTERYPFIVETMKVRNTAIYSARGRKIHLRNHNKMLWRSSREVLGKTGWTRSARHCFVGRIRTGGGQKMFFALLGSRNLWRDVGVMASYRYGTSWKAAVHSPEIVAREDVKKLQLGLKRAGFNPGPVDGRWGSATEKALRRFQRANGLRVDGVPGPQTMRKLSVRAGSVSNGQARRLQTALKRAGYYRGRVDGIWGPRSRLALNSFLRTHPRLNGFSLEKLQAYR